MNRDQIGRNQRDYIRFRESDSPGKSSDDSAQETDGSFTHADHRLGRFGGINRFGEQRIRHDSFQDDQYTNDYDPTYEDEYGKRRPYEHGGKRNSWSEDIRSEASRENHFGKGPKGYQRSEARIKEEACEILTRNHELDASEIEVELKDRCLYLKGEVASRGDKRLAEELVEDIAGIDDVQNQLTVKKKIEGWIPGLGKVDKDLQA